jgi:hypothetical protein
MPLVPVCERCGARLNLPFRFAPGSVLHFWNSEVQCSRCGHVQPIEGTFRMNALGLLTHIGESPDPVATAEHLLEDLRRAESTGDVASV